MIQETLPRPPHPVAFDVAYPERLSRASTFFKILLAIPQIIVVYTLLLPLAVLTFIAWFAILFTGRYPKGFFDFTTGVARWQANVFAYCALLRDEYPPFSFGPGAYPLTLDIPYPERQSRWRLFIRIFAIVPNHFVFYFMQLAALFTTVISWFAILATGRYPRSLFDFSVGVQRWYQRQFAYTYLFRDEYPPYSSSADARPGPEILSLVIGVPLFFLFVVGQFLPFIGLLGTHEDRVSVQAPLSQNGALLREAPSGVSNSTRITLLGYDAEATPPRNPAKRITVGYHFVAFQVRAEKDGVRPTLFSPYFFRLHDCANHGYSPYATSSVKTSFNFGIYWFRGHDEGTVYFEIPDRAVPCDLIYHAGLGEVHFNFGR